MKKSNKEIFREVNLRRKMDRMFKFSSPPHSFEELKEKLQEVQRNLEEEQEKQKQKSR
tara:strand:- start:566 stop:739 length:174 start_codon:yes stop_codon:yes gene_type:complete